MINNVNFTIQHSIPLAPYSTFHIGGVAREFVEVKTPDELIEVVSWAKKNNRSYKLFAGGSNVVFPDEGIDALVIQIHGGVLEANGKKIVAVAGAPLADLVSLATRQGLAGIEKLVGIPGTVGGAIVGNAGAYGATISDHLDHVEVWDGKSIKELNRHECGFSYRDSVFKHNEYIVLRAVFQLTPKDTHTLQKTSEEILLLRLAKYKPGLACPGSFFKNIPVGILNAQQIKSIGKEHVLWEKVPAGYLLDQVRARGMKVGGIKIADFHGNLFINEGNGTANAVKELAELLKKRVYERFEVKLEEEIRYF